jgi:hypothetical protein
VWPDPALGAFAYEAIVCIEHGEKQTFVFSFLTRISSTRANRSRSVAKSLHTSSWTELPLELLWVRKEEVAADLGSETRAWDDVHGQVVSASLASGGR